MSEEESFIVLGSTPTPSMENYLADESIQICPKVMEASVKTNSLGNFSILQKEDESLRFISNSAITNQPKTKTDMINGSLVNGEAGGNPLAASVIMGETNSALFQTFPSLMQSSMPIDEIQVLQHMMNEHGQMKESLQKANVAMRKNFTNIQKWQDEVKAKYAEQVRLLDEQRATIERFSDENKTLKQSISVIETKAKEREIHLSNEKQVMERELDEIKKQILAERTAASHELSELKKELSEKDSILKNMAQQIEQLELEKQEFVVVKNNKPETVEASASMSISKEEHDRQIKVLQREMSVIVAKNLELDDMKNIYVDELNCLKVNLTAAQELLVKNRVEIGRQAKDIETKDVSLAENIRELKTLSEQVDVLTAQLDIYKNDFEAERTARAELASEKDRILSDLKLLQRRNQQLIEEVQNGRTAQDDATRAANEALDRRAGREPTPTTSGASVPAPASEEQQYDRPILRCPLCNKGYHDLATLQNHVEDCVGTE